MSAVNELGAGAWGRGIGASAPCGGPEPAMRQLAMQDPALLVAAQ